MNKHIVNLVEGINAAISNLKLAEDPGELYDPIKYIMNLGGKRLRPLLVLLSYELFHNDSKTIINHALSVEVFHNFTLMHDDIMDQAPLRRGQTTVHEKWNQNIAILSGDVMLVKAYEILLSLEDKICKEAIRKFNACAIEVCEGQQLDMNFETMEMVSESDYLEMIRKKTAVLLGFSMEMGAILANTDQNNQKLLKEFGTNIGLGFQLKDDLLDVYADRLKFGKQVGGDIIANKKTFLLISAMELATGENKKRLKHWLDKKTFDKTEKVNAVKAIYDQLGIKTITENKMDRYFDLGFQSLNKLDIPSSQKEVLINFTLELIKREK